MKIKMILLLVGLMAVSAFAGVKVKDNSQAILGVASIVHCYPGQNCVMTHDSLHIKPSDEVVLGATNRQALTSSLCGETISSNGVGSGVLLPVAASNIGCRYTFVTSDTSAFYIFANGDTIYGQGGGPSGTSNSLKATGYIGAAVTLQAIGSGKWASVPPNASYPIDASHP